MSHGKVKTYYLTEEERLAYIAKHPIIVTDHSPLRNVKHVTPEQYKKAGINGNKNRKVVSKLDSIDIEQLHKRYIAGERIDDIAQSLNITAATLYNYISKLRYRDPEKWTRPPVR